MVEVGGIKLKKKIYNVSVRKRYQYAGRYKIRKRTYADIIRDIQKSILTKKGEKTGKIGESGVPPKGGTNVIVLVTFILLGIIVLISGWVYLSSQIDQIRLGGQNAQVEKPLVNNLILNGQTLDAGERRSDDRVALLLIDYKTTNLKNYTINITNYKDVIPSQVFILESEKFEAGSYPEFIRSLREELGKRKTLVNDISISQLETIPQGAIVIIPSGVMPKEMLGIDSNIDIEKLVDKGIVFIYIGEPFKKMLKGNLVVSTPGEVIKNIPFAFNENAQLQSTDEFHLFQPLYQVSSRGSWSSRSAYGSVSILKKGNGAFIFVPQTLDGGWRGKSTVAAGDIARIVNEIPWSAQEGESKIYHIGSSNNYSATEYFYSNTFKGTTETLKAEFTGYSPTGSLPIEQVLFYTVEKEVRGDLNIENGYKVVSSNVTNNFVRLNANLKEPTPAQPSMSLSIVDKNGNEIQSIPQGNIDDQAEASFDIPVYVNDGEYTVKLVDDGGKVYAQTYMKVVSIDIKYNPYKGENAHSYVFDITMDGNPISLAEVNVKVDNGQSGTYKFSDKSTLLVDVNQYTGGDHLPFGNHNFEFVAGGLKVNVPVAVERQRSLFTDPFFYGIVIFAVLIVGAGVIFARREEVHYSVDIPDFPPVARTKIALAGDVILSIFEKVNENYRWQNTPLTPSEVKNGFKDIFYKGKPTYITDYNVEYLLEELEKKGFVKESLGYFGLKSWEERAKKSIEYLSMLRKLRDICVDNAVPFTGLKESKVSDSEVTVAGQQMFLHFYDPQEDLRNIFKNALGTIGKGITIILFKSKADKAAFEAIVHSPSAAPLIMKMEKESGAVQFLTGDEFEKMVKEFKMI